MTILKKHVKILRYVRRHEPVRVSVLDHKFAYDAVRDLLECKYLICKNDTRPEDGFFQKTGEFPPASLITLTNDGTAEVESHDWLDWEFLARSLFLPIVISVATTLITLFLRGVLLSCL